MFFKALAATALGTVLATSAFAQGNSDNAGNGNGNNGIGAEMSGNKGPTMKSPDMESTDMQSGTMNSDMPRNYGQIISSLQNGSETPSDWATEIDNLSDTAQVDVVTLDELRGNAAGNAAALDNALAKSGTEMTDVRTAIENNAEIQAALDAQGLTEDDVVAVQVEGDSQVTLIVDKTA